MRRGRSSTSLRDGIAVAVVVIALGVLATRPRAQPAPAIVVSAVPAGPCDVLAPDRRHGCLEAALALLAR